MPGLSMAKTPMTCLPSNFKLSVSDSVDRLEVMHRLECTHYMCADYIKNDESAVDRECRIKMCEWSYQVTDFCKFKRETVAISLSYLDRFLSTSRPMARRALYNKKDYQLAAMTCLYLAIKLFEPMAMDASLLAEISHGCYTEKNVVEMEQEILTALCWRMNGPTAHDFLGHLMVLLPSSACEDLSSISTLYDIAKFQVELAVCDYDLALQKPSAIALAAILNSMEGIDSKTFTEHVKYEYLQMIFKESGLHLFSAEVSAVRERLLNLFASNIGFNLDQAVNMAPIVNERCKPSSAEKLGASSSPISVTANLFQDNERGSRARCA